MKISANLVTSRPKLLPPPFHRPVIAAYASKPSLLVKISPDQVADTGAEENLTTEEIFTSIHSNEKFLSDEAYDAEIKRRILHSPSMQSINLMPNSDRLVFLRNPNKSAHEEKRILSELFKAIDMPYYRKYIFEPLVRLAENSDKKIAVVIGEVPGSNGSNQDIRGYGYMVTITPSLAPNDGRNRFTLSSIGNEFSETLAELYESVTYNLPSEKHQGVTHTRPYQEATWAIDMMIESYCKEIPGFESQNGNSRQNKLLTRLDDASAKAILKKIDEFLVKVHKQDGYRGYKLLIGAQKARRGAELLNRINLKTASIDDRIEFVAVPLLDKNREIVVDSESGEIVYTLKPKLKERFKEALKN